ncbi:hypothetical protein [Bacteroides sp.]
MKKFKYIFLLSCFCLAACTQDDEWQQVDPQPEEESMDATIHLNLQCAEIVVDPSTRSTTPQDPQTDNPMYHLYLLHYNKEGQLIKTDTQENDLGDPQLTCKWNPTLRVTADAVETICLIANLKGAAPAAWPETLAQLKESCATLKIGSNGLIEEKKMYMFGYYEGTLNNGQYINIMMGRMVATLKFVIGTNNTDNRYRITKIEIQNTSRETFYFPHDSKESNFGDNIAETFAENDVNAIGKDLSSERSYYYQTGENINPANSKRTTVVITAKKGTYSRKSWSYGSAQTYTVVLGADAPGTSNRNYSLYRNNNYTFNIQLN